MTDFQMLEKSFCEFGLASTYLRFSDTFNPKVHLFENSLLKILAQLYGHVYCLRLFYVPQTNGQNYTHYKFQFRVKLALT